jgi:N-acetylglucosaminyldiphosphoundecaprenol N-acetyl-beta-D-mannosaminyltransferase
MAFKAPNSESSILARSEADHTNPSVTRTQSNLARSVYCVLGVPIDAINLSTVVEKIEEAATKRSTLVISTPNLNFLVTSLSDPEFRESLLESDLCPPDGIPIVWIARLIGLPIKERAAGADLLDRLQFRGKGRRLSVFLFGGSKGVAAEAAAKINARAGCTTCVGTLDPGFCEVDEMSKDHIIEAVNTSGADFLALSLGAKKGLVWLQRNHHQLTIPVRSHLGAAINFQAGTLKRAPAMVRAWGFEWLWRIKEERYLWKRYGHDGLVLLRLLLTRVLPLAVLTRWQQLRRRYAAQDLLIKTKLHDQSITITLSGAALESNVPNATLHFQQALAGNKDVVIDLSDTRQIDPRFLGLLLMLRKELRNRGAQLRFTAVPPGIESVFCLNELGFLLQADPPKKVKPAFEGRYRQLP